ncbi:alpha/beta hydrolase [Segetibacter sp. 3557_3]|uniref:alpha/beta hydrolase n=1 Tax=Segetibacter sp. 3557_3 TaxID=2547429 RepID=UPI0010589F66|nr:alpha/beta hydrolase [Segetibacter sp. 3557_3]TDH26174.1 alpha/beta hydrolase [Segetibacter sp. 3557_3]
MATPLLLCLLLTTSLSFNKKTNEEVSLAKQDYLDVSYGTHRAQKVDVFLPAGRTRTATKVIVFIHGGSWSGGDKSEFNAGIKAIRDHLPDFAIFNINYRLAAAPNNIYPTQINDVQSALDFIKRKSDEYQVNTSKIVLIGASAGAHLALLQAYKFNDGNIKAVVNLFGPTDLTDLYFNHPFPTGSQPVLRNFLGTTPTNNSARYKETSPINYVTPQSVPTRIFHGEADPVVPVAQSINLKKKLEAAKVKVEMTIYPGAGHGWFDANIADTYASTVKFIRQNVQ